MTVRGSALPAGADLGTSPRLQKLLLPLPRLVLPVVVDDENESAERAGWEGV